MPPSKIKVDVIPSFALSSFLRISPMILEDFRPFVPPPLWLPTGKTPPTLRPPDRYQHDCLIVEYHSRPTSSSDIAAITVGDATLFVSFHSRCNLSGSSGDAIHPYLFPLIVVAATLLATSSLLSGVFPTFRPFSCQSPAGLRRPSLQTSSPQPQLMIKTSGPPLAIFGDGHRRPVWCASAQSSCPCSFA